MPIPAVASRHGTFTLEYAGDHGLKFEIDHVHAESRSGEVHAEVRVLSTLVGATGLLHQGRFQLTGTQSKRTLAKHLAERTPGRDIDWQGVIEQVAVKCLALFRVGEPAILLRDADEPDNGGVLLPPFVLSRMPTVWFGDGATFKSYFALAAGLSIHSGRGDLLGLDPNGTEVVGYLDWEMQAWDHRKRMHEILGATAAPDLVYVPCAAAIWNDMDRLRSIVAERKITFVIVDSVALACAGFPLTSEEAPIRFYSALRQLGVGALCIAHKTKAEDGDRYPYGSAYWAHLARATWNVKKEQQTGAAASFVAFHNRKANTTEALPPIAFEVAFGDGRVKFSQREFTKIEAFEGDQDAWQRIAELLRRNGPMDQKAISDELDIPLDTVSKTTRRFGKIFTRISQKDRSILVSMKVARGEQ